MRLLPVLVVLTTYYTECLGAGCSGNNCLRAVQRIGNGRNGTADCQSFFRVTVTPTPSTIFSTVTVTTTVSDSGRKKRVVDVPCIGEITDIRAPIDNGFEVLKILQANALQQRATTPSPSSITIPSYASPCSSLGAYSSACSCLSIPQSTTTAPVPTTTSIRTITSFLTTSSLPTRIANLTTSATNTTSPPVYSNSTSIYFNTSTATSTPTQTHTLDTTCGETSTPFSLQITNTSSSLLTGWFAHLSGNGVLFTSVKSKATSFSVEGSGHLCAVGYKGVNGYPIIAVVGNLTSSPGGAVWFIDGKEVEAVDGSYAPVQCLPEGAGLSCGAGDIKNWVSCGLQLDLTSGGSATVVVDGLNCSAIGLDVV